MHDGTVLPFMIVHPIVQVITFQQSPISPTTTSIPNDSAIVILHSPADSSNKFD